MTNVLAAARAVLAVVDLLLHNRGAGRGTGDPKEVAMREEPTAAERRNYESNGYLVVEEYLDAAELERWQVALEGALAARGDRRLAFGDGSDGIRLRDDVDQRYYDQVFTQRINLWQSDPTMRALLVDSTLANFAGRLAGVDGLRIWHDQALVKPAYGNPTAYHLDVPYWSFTSPDAITIWLALDDATLENGCLYYVPGSHKAAKYANVGIGPELGALFDVYPEWRGVPAVACPVPAGGALLHNGLTFHGAGANMTAASRRAMTCAYMPDGATFNGQQNVLPPAYFASLHVGDVLDREEHNPLVYRRQSGG